MGFNMLPAYIHGNDTTHLLWAKLIFSRVSPFADLAPVAVVIVRGKCRPVKGKNSTPSLFNHTTFVELGNRATILDVLHTYSN